MKCFGKCFISLVSVFAVVLSIIPFSVFSAQAKSLCENGHRQLTSVAHRGYSAEAPENTLPAYRMAKEKGFTYVECDVAYTADGVPVLLHLDNIKSTSNGSGNVYDLTYQQLLQYDFGSWKGSQFKGTKIPTFEEFISLCADLELHPYIELKESGKFTQEKISQLVSILEKYDMLDNCTWITFIHDYLFYVRNLDSDARMGLLWPNDVNQSLISKAQSIKTTSNEVFLNVNYDSLTTSGINKASSNGFALEVYTINSEQTMANLPDYISGFTSDFILAPSVTDGLDSVVTPPTCTDKGYTTYTCDECGYILKDGYVSALGHSFGTDDYCVRCNFKREKFTYYVYETGQGGMDTNDGLSASAPVATFNKAIEIAKSEGATKGDTVTFYLKGNVNWGGNINNNGISTNWEVLTSHDFKIIVASEDGTAVIGNGEKNIILGGDMQFDAVKINCGSSWKSLCFNGYNIVLNNTSFTNDSFDFILGTRSSRTVDVATNVTLNTYRPKIFVGNSYQTLTYNQKFTLNLQGNSNINTSNIILVMGPNDTGKTIYNVGADMIVNIPNTLTFQSAEKLEIGTNGYLNIINNVTSKSINLSDISFTSATKSKVWIINHKTNIGVTSTDKAGVFTVPNGYIATATSIGGNVIKSVNGKLTLTAGQYDVDVQLYCEHIYTNNCDTNCNLCGEIRTVTHNYQWVIDKEATCGKNGIKHRECTVCGDKKDENTKIDSTNAHIYDGNCDIDCNACGATRTVTHNYQWVIDKEATCGKNGIKHRECTVCGDKKDENTKIDSTNAHIYDGNCDIDCNACGATRTVTHNYQWVIDKEATCGKNGIKHRECTVCGDKKDENTKIDSTNAHIYDGNCDIDCNTCGATRTVIHNYGNLKFDDTYHWNECDCGAIDHENRYGHGYSRYMDQETHWLECYCGHIIDVEQHDYEWIVDTQPTCYQNGFKHQECVGCGKKISENTVMNLTDKHVYDNDCDIDCNTNGCGYIREIKHIFDDDLDKECNVEGCGFVRTLGALLREENGVKYYYFDGVKSNATGIVDFEGKKMYINKGRFLGASGLVTISGKKMYINKGYFTGASGLVTVSGKKMYINKGYFTGASGLVTISGKKMYINKGYFTGASGLVTISGKKMYINKGYFTGATGFVKIGTKRYYINKGYFTGASGKVKVGGKVYTVVNGVVK